MKSTTKLVLAIATSCSASSLLPVKANAGIIIAVAGAAAHSPGLAKFGGGVAIAGGTLYLATKKDDGFAKVISVFYIVLDGDKYAPVIGTGLTVQDYLGIDPKTVEGVTTPDSEDPTAIANALVEQGVPADTAAKVAPKLTSTALRLAMNDQANQ